MPHNTIEQDLLKELFDYDDGKLIYKVSRGTCKKGTVAGSVNSKYSKVKINRKMYVLHRLIYVYHNGSIKDDNVIDHIDGDTQNNRIDNLRQISQVHNIWNTIKTKGYCWSAKAKKWEARITTNGKRVFLGAFASEQDAQDAYLKAKQELHIIKEVA